MILNDLGLKHGTDKNSQSHDYLDFYERLFTPFRDTATAILEIGVANGPSLRMWRDYFPLAKIIGIDIHDECKQHEDSRITVEIGQQADIPFLQSVWQQHGPFNLILDDASHRDTDQMISFATCYPLMQSRSFYVIEDLVTPQIVDYIAQMTKAIAGAYSDPQFQRIRSVSSYRGTCAIEFG